MIEAQNAKYVNLTPPAAIVDNASFTVAELDTRGWRYLEILIILGATDIAVAALKATESDTTGAGHTDIPGADYSVAPATLPSATNDDGIFRIAMDLTKRKRFIDLTFTAGDGAAGTYACVVARLSRGETAPITAAGRGLVQDLLV